MRVGIALTIASMMGLFLLALASAQVIELTGHARPSQQPVSTRCSTSTSGLKLCATTPIPPEFDLPDNAQNEWTYCGNANGSCTVNAYINGEWAIVKLVKP